MMKVTEVKKQILSIINDYEDEGCIFLECLTDEDKQSLKELLADLKQLNESSFNNTVKAYNLHYWL